jgi:abortive infection bacteriophage resistance protein
MFRAGTTFRDVLDLYNFDRELRLLALDAIERIEVALRAALVNELGCRYDPHFYCDPQHFHSQLAFQRFYDTATTAKYLAISHYRRTYHTPPEPPIWAVTEALTFGDLSHLYSGLNHANRRAVAVGFTFPEKVLTSWFKSLTILRNVAAHHNRLWNASLKVNEPKRAHPVRAEMGASDSFAARATVLQALVTATQPGHGWGQRLAGLLARYASVDAANLGFAKGWAGRPFWR